MGRRRSSGTLKRVEGMRVIIPEQRIAARVQELAEAINRDFAGRKLLVLGILKGSLIFLADLVRRLRLPIRYEVVVLSSYKDGTTPGDVDFFGELPAARPDEEILIVEDIIDTGHTLERLRDWLNEQYDRPVSLCVFLNKLGRRDADVAPDYVGFTLRTRAFVVGYGLDYAEGYRNLPYIAALEAGETA
jgi:hypoxanthine phosphoribosyltransferase